MNQDDVPSVSGHASGTTTNQDDEGESFVGVMLLGVIEGAMSAVLDAILD